MNEMESKTDSNEWCNKHQTIERNLPPSLTKKLRAWYIQRADAHTEMKFGVLIG